MSDFVLPLHLQTSFAVSTADEHANTSFKSLDQVQTAVYQMRGAISDLERIRALYVIHLRNYQSDFDIMRSISNELRLKIDDLDQQLLQMSSASNQVQQTTAALLNTVNNKVTPTQNMLPNNPLATLQQKMPQNIQQNLPQGLQQKNAKNVTANLHKTGGQTMDEEYNDIENDLVHYSNNNNNGGGAAPVVKQEILSQTGINLTEINWTLNLSVFTKRDISNKFSLSTNSVLCSVQYDQTGDRIAFADGRYLFILQSQTGAIEKICDIPRVTGRNELYSRILRFSPDGNYIALSYCISNIAIFSVKTGQIVANFEEHTSNVTSLAFISDSSRLFSGGYDGLMCVWDLNRWCLLSKVQHGSLQPIASGNDANAHDPQNLNKDNAIVSIAVGCNDSYIAVGFMKGQVGIYEPTMTQQMSTFTAHSEFILSISASRLEPLLLTASQDTTVKLWSLRGVASCLMTFTGHKGYVISACFSKDDQMILTGSKDETLCGWIRATGKLIFQIQAHKNTIFEVNHSPVKNEFVSCSGDGIICAWEYQLPK